MASAPSNFTAPLTKQTETETRKRKVSSKIMDEDFNGVESNTFTKHLKQLANAACTASAKQKQRQLSAEDAKDTEDEGSTPNGSPKSLSPILEAADRNDHPASALEDFGEEEDDNDNDEPEEYKPVETAEAQRSESIKQSKRIQAHPIFPARVTVGQLGVPNIRVLPANPAHRDH